MSLVMVIEDEEAIATLLSYNLEKEGYKIIYGASDHITFKNVTF